MRKWTMTLDGEILYKDMPESWYVDNVAEWTETCEEAGYQWFRRQSIVELTSKGCDYRIRLTGLEHLDNEGVLVGALVHFRDEEVYWGSGIEEGFSAATLRCAEWQRNDREVSNHDGSIKIVPSLHGGGYVDTLHLRDDGLYWRTPTLCHNQMGWENWQHLVFTYVRCKPIVDESSKRATPDVPTPKIPPVSALWGRNDAGELCRIDGATVKPRDGVMLDLVSSDGTTYHKFAMADQSDFEVIKWAERLLPALV